MAPQYLFAGVPVAGLDAALAWYERFLGRAPDGRPHENEAIWQVTDTGWIYVVRDERRAGKGLMTVMVDDLDEELAAIQARGIATGPVETAPGRYRKSVLADPEGNVIALGQALSGGEA